jgi:hypothetical protein
MNNHSTLFRYLTAALAVTILCTSTSLGQKENQKLAQAGMKFLSVGLSARQTALADAFTAVQGGSESMFYNPSGMSGLKGMTDVSLGMVQWIGDIQHYWLAVAFAPWDGDYGVLGLSFQFTNYGEVQSTIRANNAQGYLDAGIIKPNASVAGLTYSKAISDRFAVGGTIKFVSQDLGTGYVQVTYNTTPGGTDEGFYADSSQTVTNTLLVPAFDFGLQYKTGFKSLIFGMAVRNFSREVEYVKENFQLPLTFRIGLAMNMFDMLELDPSEHALLLAIDAEHPRDYPEQLKIGLEYLFLNSIALRAGYVSPADEHQFSFGFGVQQKLAGIDFGLDYSYTPFGLFTTWSTNQNSGGLPTVSRLSFRFKF